MPDRDGIDLTEAERQLAVELMALRQVMRAAARSRAMAPDSSFLLTLRTRLVEPEPIVPDATFQRRLRRRLTRRRPRWPWRPALAASAVVAGMLALILLLRPQGPPSRTPPSAAGVPRPSTQDLARGYPPVGLQAGGGGVLLPTMSRIAGLAGQGYPKRLRLAAGSLPATPASLPVYRLASRPFGRRTITTIARRLGLEARPLCVHAGRSQPTRCDRETWTVVANTRSPLTPLHSLAVSPAGDFVYHDLTYDQFAYHGPSLGRRRAIRIARAWIRDVQGRTAGPVLAVGPARTAGPPNAGLPFAVAFGWQRGMRASVPAATLWVAPTGRVVEAQVWPPITRRRSVASRDIGEAWSDVARGKAPIAVTGGIALPVPGTGSVSRVGIVQVLVAPGRGSAYLEPAYRFSGTVKLIPRSVKGRPIVRPWFALAPAVARP